MIIIRDKSEAGFALQEAAIKLSVEELREVIEELAGSKLICFSSYGTMSTGIGTSFVRGSYAVTKAKNYSFIIDDIKDPATYIEIVYANILTILVDRESLQIRFKNNAVIHFTFRRPDIASMFM